MFFGGGGFDGFPGGFPGGMPGGMRGARGDVDNETLYKSLGLQKDCSQGAFWWSHGAHPDSFMVVLFFPDSMLSACKYTKRMCADRPALHAAERRSGIFR